MTGSVTSGGGGGPLQGFLKLFFADQEKGCVRGLDAYAALFPGHRDEIARSLSILQGGESAGGPLPWGEAELPEAIGPYRILQRLGRGGQGEVFLAQDTRVDRKVAVKVLGRAAGLSAAGVGRFLREAEVASRLKHPGICPVYDVNRDGDLSYIVMPWIEGESLARMIARTREVSTGSGEPATILLPDGAGGRSGPPAAPAEPRAARSEEPRSRAEINRVLLLVEQVARAVHAAHEAGVLHRDIKPGNVMVTPEGRPIVLDFGLAHDVVGEAPTLTETGQLLGTLHYMAPEQLELKGSELDRRVDVYALGVTLYECLTLRRPFEGASHQQIWRAVLEQTPPDPREVSPDLPRDLSVVLATALDKDRGRRYATALDLAEELRRVREFEPIAARRAGPWLRLSRWARRNPGLAASLGVLLIVLVAGLAVSLSLLASARDALDRERRALGVAEDERRAKELRYDALELESLPGRMRELWPAVPERVGGPAGMDAWIARAEELLAKRPEYERSLARIRERALPYGEAERRADRERAATEERIDLLDRLRAYAAALEASPRDRIDELEAARDRIARLEEVLVRRATWRFEDPDDQAAHASLAALVDGLPELEPLLEEMRRRRAFAVELDRRTLEEPRELWRAAARRVAADPTFGGLRLAPQRGLVPLGPDPKSGLEEFVHLETGGPPPRDPDTGRLELTEESGIVLVLLPPGTFTMGATQPGPDHPAGAPNVDPRAEAHEGPPHEVTLHPFLMGRHEVTQGQWLRATGANPSAEKPAQNTVRGRIDLRHPVEHVTWTEAYRVLRRMGLTLPTEAQWEYAARAGTTDVRWTGDDERSLEGAANVADASVLRRYPGTTWTVDPWFDDGHPVHAPVGSFRANAFGMQDVLGNVMEWCRDGFGSYERPVREGDGLRLHPWMRFRMVRGSHYGVPVRTQRSALRARFVPDFKNPYLGFRAARALRRARPTSSGAGRGR